VETHLPRKAALVVLVVQTASLAQASPMRVVVVVAHLMAQAVLVVLVAVVKQTMEMLTGRLVLPTQAVVAVVHRMPHQAVKLAVLVVAES
jgi:hypothetical protein